MTQQREREFTVPDLYAVLDALTPVETRIVLALVALDNQEVFADAVAALMGEEARRARGAVRRGEA